jgi:peptide deformylase
MIRSIITYPNKILLKKSKVEKNFDEKLHILLDDMYDTMAASEGVGLAAVQIGVLLNVLIVDLFDSDKEVRDKSNLIEMINPKITNSENIQFQEEGCLSVPGFQAKVKRFDSIEVEYYDRFGTLNNIKVDDYLSIAIQHEMDHLNGELFINRISIIDMKKFKKNLKIT